MKKMAVWLIGAMLLGACSSSGNTQLKNFTQAQAKYTLVEGKTTKADVERSLGSADSVSFTDSGNEIWTYRYSEMTPHVSSFIPVVGLFSSGQDVQTKEVVILFNKDNIVEKFTMRNSKSTERIGIFGK